MNDESFVNWNRLLLIRTDNGFIIAEGPKPEDSDLSDSTVCESKSALGKNVEKWAENND